MRKTRKIAAFLTAALMAVSTFSVTANAAYYQSEPYDTEIYGKEEPTCIATVYQIRAGASGYYEMPIAYVYYKSSRTIFNNIKAYGGINTTAGTAYTSVQLGDRILAVTEDATKNDGTVWSDPADVGRSGLNTVTFIGHLNI